MTKLEQLIQDKCPNGVTYKTLQELGNFVSGLTGKKKDDFVDGNAKFITYMNCYKNPALKIDVDDKVKINPGEKQNTLEYGDVIFTGSSENLEEAGLTSVLTTKTDEKLYLNSFCFAFRFSDKNLFLPDFSKHLFRSEYLRKQIKRCVSGVTRFNVSKAKLASVQLPVPPLEVQREIVEILDKFTLLTAELTAELTARKEQFETYKRQLLRNVDGKTYKLKQIGKVCMCKRIMKDQTSANGDVPFYKIGTFGKEADAFIEQSLFDEYKSKYSYPKKGDILISCSGTIGRTVVFDGKPAYFQDSNIVWLSNDETVVLNSYLRYIYQLNPFITSTGGTISRLYNSGIEEAEVLIPELKEQQRIVDILDRFDTLCNDISSGLPAEIEARQKQYEYYRDKLLTFNRIN